MVRLREIKPNEVICCKSIEEMQTLIDYFKINADAVKIWNYKSSLANDENRRDCLSFDPHGKYDGFCDREYYEENGRTITEFSDLIIPELSAEEVLRITTEICHKYSNLAHDCKDECPFCHSTFCKDWMVSNMDSVIAICEQWKADHEKKEPELEWVNVCRIIQVQDNGVKKCVHEKDITGLGEHAHYSAVEDKAEEILKRYMSMYDGNYIAVVERVCRVKK